MILVCHDCDDPDLPGYARVWRYPCRDCAEAFLASHRASGHNISSREETFGDRWAFGRF